MRIAVIADIHGNALALEAVLADIDRQAIDTIVNLGDHFSGPLDPARTADLLMARDMIAISGNHDRALLTLDPLRMIPSDRFAHAALTERHRAWLSALPAVRHAANGTLFLCHGTPRSDVTYWLEDLTADGVVHRADRTRIERFADGIEAEVILCGHTHIARQVTLADGRIVLNPGSVGCPAYEDDEPVAHKVETGSPRAAYAVIERGDAGWDVTFRTVAYDHGAMARLAARNGRPDWARGLSTGWM